MEGFGRIFKMTPSQVNIAGNYEELCEKVVQEVLALSNKSIAAHAEFSLVLSGGSTPKGVYQCMASTPYRNRFNWEKKHFLRSDERWVPPDDPRSNFRMASDALLTHVGIPSENIHPMPAMNGTIKDAATRYAGTIADFFKLKKDGRAQFDLILLGLGEDGHTASLFPGNPALRVQDRWVVETSQKGIPEQRITLTLPVLNGADTIFFLVSGHEKANMVHQVLENEGRNMFPANEIMPAQGKLYWFLDKAAASGLVKNYV
jgi:6-phosphogluconolactonase